MSDGALREELELLRDIGFTHLDLDAARARVGPPTVVAPASDSTVIRESVVAPSGGQSDDAGAALAEFAKSIAECDLCRLASGRTQVVFGVGNPSARLMFIGEGPGRDEDIKGEPFVGRAGELLTDIIKAMKLRREDVYIANAVKCRPPENRNPEPDEMEACRPYLMRQIDLIQPEVIVTLGRFGLQTLFERSIAISSVRGQWMDWNGRRVMPTYHPAYLLRNPAAKKDVWSDMKKVMAELGIAV
ncbi:MAG: uracil-DNA glycosylase [Thermoanaerobaculia bacterium]|nr:uracil-DNA glycosylase [Thermoanaerobaculia bacterium]